jgi:putative transposase
MRAARAPSVVSHPGRILATMICSVERAPVYAHAKLVVDGRDASVFRKAEFAFNPSRRMERQLLGLLGACCEIYNAALEERRGAWRWNRESVSWRNQFNQVTDLRGVRDDVLVWGVQPIRTALKRLDEAFDAFYRRVKVGQTPGFPRFKARSRFDTIGWDEPRSWKLDLTGRTLTMQGCGTVGLPRGALRQLHRLADRAGVATTLTVTRRRAGTGWAWRACVGFKQVLAAKYPARGGDRSTVGCDRGVAVAVATSSGDLLEMPPFMATARSMIVDLQRQRATKRTGSRAWNSLNRRIAKAYRNAKQQTDHWARETANQLVDAHGVIVFEHLRLTHMTRSARGTKENPGINVAAKQALNRKLHDAALGKVVSRTCAKAEEAGRIVWLVDPRGTSQTCAACGHRHFTNRRSRDLFLCRRCGHAAHADTNAAEVIATRGHAAQAAWRTAGAPALVRSRPRLQRRRTDDSERASLTSAA